MADFKPNLDENLGLINNLLAEPEVLSPEVKIEQILQLPS